MSEAVQLDESEPALSPLRSIADRKSAFKVLVLSGAREGPSDEASALVHHLVAVDWDIVVDLDRNPDLPSSAWKTVAGIGNLRRRLVDAVIGPNGKVSARPQDMEWCKQGNALLWVKGSSGPNRDKFKYLPLQEFVGGTVTALSARPVVLVGVLLSATSADRVRQTVDNVVVWLGQQRNDSDYPLSVSRLAVPEANARGNEPTGVRFFTAPLNVFCSKLSYILGEPVPPESIRMAGQTILTLNAVGWRGLFEPVHEDLGAPGTGVANEELDSVVRSFGAVLLQAPHPQAGLYEVDLGGSSKVVVPSSKLLYLDFLRGSTLPWSLIAVCSDPNSDSPELFRRSEFERIHTRISHLLNRTTETWGDKATLVVCEHEASSGATTLGRQLLKSFADKFPCFIVNDTTSSTVDALAAVQGTFFPNKPLLLLLDDCSDPVTFDHMLRYQHPRRAKAIVLALSKRSTVLPSVSSADYFKIAQLSTKDAASLEDHIQRVTADILPASTLTTGFDIKMPFFYGLVYFGVYYRAERVQSHVAHCVDAAVALSGADHIAIAGLLAVAAILTRFQLEGLCEHDAVCLSDNAIVETATGRSAVASAILNLLIVKRKGRDRIFFLPNVRIARAIEQKLADYVGFPSNVLALVWLLVRLFDFDLAARLGVSIQPFNEFMSKLDEITIPIDKWLDDGDLPRDTDSAFLKALLSGLFSRHGDGEDLSDDSSDDLDGKFARPKKFSKFVSELVETLGQARARTLFSLTAAASGDVHVLAHYARFVVVSAEYENDLDTMRAGYVIVEKALRAAGDPPPRLCHLAGALALRIIEHLLHSPKPPNRDSLDIVRQSAQSAEVLLKRINDNPHRGDGESFTLAALSEIWRADLRLSLHKYGTRWARSNDMSPFKFFEHEPDTSLFMNASDLRLKCLPLLDHADELNGQTDDSGRLQRERQIREKLFDTLRVLVLDQSGLTPKEVVQQLRLQLGNGRHATFLPALAGQILIATHPKVRAARWRPFGDPEFTDTELLATHKSLMEGAFSSVKHTTVHLATLRDLLAISIELGTRNVPVSTLSSVDKLFDLLKLAKGILRDGTRTDPVLWTLFGAIAMATLKAAQTIDHTKKALELVMWSNAAVAKLADTAPAVQNNASATAFVFVASASGLHCIRDSGYIRQALTDCDMLDASPSTFWDHLAYDRLWRIRGTLTNNGRQGIVNFSGVGDLALRVTHLRDAPGYRKDLPVDFYPVMAVEGLVLSVAKVRVETVGLTQQESA